MLVGVTLLDFSDATDMLPRDVMEALPTIWNPPPRPRVGPLITGAGARMAFGPVGAPTTPVPLGSIGALKGGAGAGLMGEIGWPFIAWKDPRPLDGNLPWPLPRKP